ncbi:cysteine-rich secretory protein 3-like [Mercenaria mercenaria]|uniref:cysteine-rich secretory protein 3-like n=1 Tax=Mercenaria mercenaria TaxID=6596 RepID=UPI00234F6158|nr:cysteine-rich secretory protein 3-like [Mercenaria mercenaria]
MCSGGISQHLMNDTARKLIEDLHNDLRSSVYPPAANMMLMQYNKVLEKEAQIWAEQCQSSHDKPELRFLAGRFSVGQNIAYSSVYNWTNAFEQWKGENGSFKYGGPNNISAVRNLVQMMNAETSLLGCGVSKCGSNYSYVCNYAPLMNDSNVDTPYLKSASDNWCDSCSSSCDNVTSHLCDCFGKFCINGGKMDLQTCTCNCIKEVKTYDPEHCVLRCDNKGDDPGCDKLQYQKSTCRSNPETAFHCPWMCDICPYAGINYTGEGVALLPWEKGLPYCTNGTNASISLTASQPSAVTTSTTNTNRNNSALHHNGGSSHNGAIVAAYMNVILLFLYSTVQFLNACQ